MLINTLTKGNQCERKTQQSIKLGRGVYWGWSTGWGDTIHNNQIKWGRCLYWGWHRTEWYDISLIDERRGCDDGEDVMRWQRVCDAIRQWGYHAIQQRGYDYPLQQWGYIAVALILVVVAVAVSVELSVVFIFLFVCLFVCITSNTYMLSEGWLRVS